MFETANLGVLCVMPVSKPYILEVMLGSQSLALKAFTQRRCGLAAQNPKGGIAEASRDIELMLGE